MKKSLVIIIFTLIIFAFVSCDQNVSIDRMLHEKAYGKTVFYASSNLSDFTTRAIKQTYYITSNDVKTLPDIFVVKSSDLASLSEEKTILAIKACINGKTIVIDYPEIEDLDGFWDKIEEILNKEEYEHLKAEHELSPYTLYSIIENYEVEDEYTENIKEHVFEAIGMHKGDLYFVHDIDDILDLDAEHKHSGVKSSHTYEDADTGDKIEETDDTNLPFLDNDWDTVTSHTIELFSKWLKERDTDTSRSDAQHRDAGLRSVQNRDAQEALKNALKAQSVTRSVTVPFSYGKKEEYDGRFDGRKEVVQVYMDFWTACDISSQIEYYLMRTSVVYNNQQLGYTNNVNSYGDGYVGPYFYKANINVKIPDGALKVPDCRPQNSSGSTNFTTGSSFNLGGNVGLTTSGPTGGITGGITVSQSTTRSIPDTKITFSQDEKDANTDTYSRAIWEITTNDIEVKKDDNYFVNSKMVCEGAKPIQTNLATYDTYALYTRPASAAAGTKHVRVEFTLNSTVGVSVFYLFEPPFAALKKVGTHHFYSSRWMRVHFPIYRPNNLSGQYIMAFTAPDGTLYERTALLNNVLKEYFPEWNTNINYYAVGALSKASNELDKVAKNYFTTVKQKITDNKKVLKDRGFSGTYRFYINNSSGSEITHFDLTF